MRFLFDCKIILFFAAGLWVLIGCSNPPGVFNPQKEWTKEELYFGLSIKNGGVVSDLQWNNFVDSVITPLFPDGITVLDAKGQYRYSNGTIVKEPTRIVVLLYNDSLDIRNSAVEKIMSAYISRFDQESILRTTNRVQVEFKEK